MYPLVFTDETTRQCTREARARIASKPGQNEKYDGEYERNGLLSELTNYDADSNGTIGIGEFEKLHAARIRSQMVDRFQALDEDGDGQVTKEEMTAPADEMQRRMERQATSGDRR